VKLFAIALILAAAACDAGHPLAGGTEDGAAIFHSVCVTCHGPTGKPSEAMVVRLGVKDLTAPALRAKITPGLVEHQVRAGSSNRLMPSFEGALNDAQIRAVAAYVASPQFVAPK